MQKLLSRLRVMHKKVANFAERFEIFLKRLYSVVMDFKWIIIHFFFFKKVVILDYNRLRGLEV